MDALAQFGFGANGWGKLLLAGASVTLAVTLASLAIGALLGSVVAAAKLSTRLSLRVAGDLYTTVFRGVPELLVIYLFYFGGSSVLTSLGRLFGAEGFLGIPTFLAGALAVGIISAAYQAEVFRGAFQAIPRGQIEAARAVGMGPFLLFRRVIVPQVFRLALPGLGNVWQLSLKDSALISVTGLAELMRTAQVGAGSTHDYFGFYIAGAVLYLAMTAVSNRVFDAAETRAGRGLRRTATPA